MPKVLLADHDRSIRELLAIAVGQILLCSIDIAEDGIEVIQKVQINDYSLAVIDINLLKLNGFEVVKQIRKIKADLPVILTSDFVHRDVETYGFKVGASIVISKPFSLIRMIESAYLLIYKQRYQVDNPGSPTSESMNQNIGS